MSSTVRRHPTIDAAVSVATEPREVWIVRWVTYDVTHRPFWCGSASDDDEHDQMWSAYARDAWPYASRDEALADPELADFWDSEDIAAERIGGAR